MYHKLKYQGLALAAILFLVTLAAGQAQAFPFREFNPGDAVPDAPLFPLDTGKEQLTLSAFKGKPYIAVFWGADLPEKVDRAAKILGEIEEMVPFLNERHVQLLSINVQNDVEGAVQQVITKSGSSAEMFKDKNLQAYKILGLYVLPSVLLVDGEGKVADGFGYSNDLPLRLKGAVEIMLGEKTAEQVAAELRPEMKELSAEKKASMRHFSFGMVMKKRGMNDAATREFLRAIEIDPNMSEAHLQLGCIYLEGNDYPKAEESLNNALKADPDSVRGRICLGELMRLQNKLDAAEAKLREVLKDHPDNFEAHYRLGLVLQDKAKEQEAIASFKDAYKLILTYSVKDE